MSKIFYSFASNLINKVNADKDQASIDTYLE